MRSFNVIITSIFFNIFSKSIHHRDAQNYWAEGAGGADATALLGWKEQVYFSFELLERSAGKFTYSKHLNNHKTSPFFQGLPLVSEKIATAPSLVPATNPQRGSTNVTRAGCTAEYLLTSSTKGRSIICKYQTNPFLSRADKKTITHIIVDEFKDRFSKLSPSELLDRACELGRLFPSEPQVCFNQLFRG